MSQNESIFIYGNGETYFHHNPSDPPMPAFLEDLVAGQRNNSYFIEILSNCSASGTINAACLYDVLTTNRTEIGETTLSNNDASESTAKANGNKNLHFYVNHLTNLNFLKKYIFRELTASFNI